MTGARRNSAVAGGGALILAFLAVPLFLEFSEPGKSAWNVFLVLFLVAIAVGAVLLQRFLVAHADEVGEARFDTSNKNDADG